MVKVITEKVKKSERRKVINIVLSGLLVIVVALSLMGLWKSYQSNQENTYEPKPSDLIESTWEMNFTTAEKLSQSKLSFDSNSVMIWNHYTGLIKPYVDVQELEELKEEQAEAGLADGAIEYDDLTVEVQDEMYIVSAHGYQQSFERVTETMIRDSNGTEYHKILDMPSHQTLRKQMKDVN